MTAYLAFILEGDLALWRNAYEPVGSYSCLGPAPSQIAGLLGAAMGMLSPRSHAALTDAQTLKRLRRLRRNGLPWPVAPALLQWEEAYDYAVACRWLGGVPRRIPWNVNGVKEMTRPFDPQPLRLQQQVIDRPRYEVLVRLNDRGAVAGLAQALRNPRFPLFLGAAFCRAIVRSVRVLDEPPTPKSEESWAYRREEITAGETVPFFCHVVNAEETFERVVADGFWVYPTPLHLPEAGIQGDPCCRGWRRLPVQGKEGTARRDVARQLTLPFRGL